MAIKKPTTSLPVTASEYRSLLQSFIQDESGIKALQMMIGPDNKIQREGMYLLEILNNVIQSPNGTKNVFQRIPQEVFGGLSEGGRRNVQASLIGRAVQSTDKTESRRIHASGYTKIQEVIGQWAERDGAWSDTPEADLRQKGFKNNPNDDGSEARVFSRDGIPVLYKTIDFSHYSDFELMLDRIAIHNAVFPEMAMHVVGFGMRDDTPDILEQFSQGFCVIISQPEAYGQTPTLEDMERGMKERFFDLSQNGFFWVNGHDNIVIADVHDQNAVISPGGKLLVFDCEAFLKTFPIENMQPDEYQIKELQPVNGRHDSQAWKEILGPEYPAATEKEKAGILFELEHTGKVNYLVNGKSIAMRNPLTRYRQAPGCQPERYYEGTVLVGSPTAFRKEHKWEIPDIQYNTKAVDEIREAIATMMPIQMDIERFATMAQAATSTEKASDLIKQLRDTGRIEGLFNGRYIVQADPANPNNILMSEPEKVSFLLWTNNTENDCIAGAGKLTPSDKERLAHGQSIEKNGRKLCFNLDRGRVDETILIQRKQKQSINVTIPLDKQKPKPRIMKL